MQAQDANDANDANDELTFVGLLPQRWQLAAATLSAVLPRCAGQMVALAAVARRDDDIRATYDNRAASDSRIYDCSGRGSNDGCAVGVDVDCDADCNCTDCIEARAMACVLAMDAV